MGFSPSASHIGRSVKPSVEAAVSLPESAWPAGTTARPTRDGGLTAAEVEQARASYGSNELTPHQKSSFWRQFFSNFGDPIIKILLAALAVNLLFLFHHFDWYESAGIAIAIFLATFVSTLSEYGSETAFEKLQEESARMTCRVRREGLVLEIPVGEVVAGDLVLLQAGERIPADGILTAGSLAVDQSALNGETKEAAKRAGDGSSDPRDLLAADRLFRGSVVCSGDGVLWVRQVGDATFYGGLAREIQEETRESPLKVRLAGLAKTISRIGYAAAVVVALADLFHSFVLDAAWVGATPSVIIGHILHAITLAITVVVVAVPEGLPMMITVVLSSNMRRMLKDHVLVRKLVGIETSGSLNILFTDKTGTLTKGQLTVSRFLAGDGTASETAADLRRRRGLWRWVELSGTCNSESQISPGKGKSQRAVGGNATDRALMTYLLPLTNQRDRPRILERVTFDSARKFSAVRIAGAGVPGERPVTLVKGAPEKILSACTRYMDENGEIRPLGDRRRLEDGWSAMTKQAMRVLALAISDTSVDESGVFSSLILIGLVGIRDEIRPEARQSVARVQGAGVQVVMITGDNRDTASAIAREAGLLMPRDGEEAVLTGGELAALSDDQVKRRLPALRVVARALPSDKSRLVRLAQEMGLVAGMTGDGINDAPALKKADVGFAMGSGTEVAKEAGDIVILDDNIASISRAILYGRTIFKSIRKFIIFQLTMNLCAVGISIIGPFIGIDTPVTVIQMLWVNIIMDTLAGLAFAGEPPLEEYMEEPPKRRDEPVLNRYMLHQILCMGLFTVGLCVLFLKLPAVRLWFRYANNPIYFMTAFFALFIFAGIFNSFNARTHRLNLFSHLLRNPAFMVIMAAVVVIQLLLIYFGGMLFRTAGLTGGELRRVMAIALLVIPADLLRKLVLRVCGRKGTL